MTPFLCIRQGMLYLRAKGTHRRQRCGFPQWNQRYHFNISLHAQSATFPFCDCRFWGWGVVFYMEKLSFVFVLMFTLNTVNILNKNTWHLDLCVFKERWQKYELKLTEPTLRTEKAPKKRMSFSFLPSVCIWCIVCWLIRWLVLIVWHTNTIWGLKSAFSQEKYK